MKNKVCELFGIESPFFAFSHCRDVVAAVSAAGGMGVLGAGTFTPEQLEIELAWLEKHLNGRPYGVDVLMAEKRFEGSKEEIQNEIPQGHRDFIKEVEQELKIPPLKENAARPKHGLYERLGQLSTHGWARPQLEVIWKYSPKFLVPALGPAPADVVAKARERNMKIGGMTGSARHAEKHINAGADVLVAAGLEGAGHNSDLSTMVLVPEVVDAAGDVPVLAGGGIGNGRQIAAAMALGASGVWMGSIWLASAESDLEAEVVDRILASDSRDTLRTRAWSGKPTRFLKTPFFDAWNREGAPSPLGTPMQRMLVAPTFEKIAAAKMSHLAEVPLGQIAGQIRERRRVRDIMLDLQAEYLEAVERMASLLSDE